MKSRPGMTRKWCQTAWHHFLSIHSTFGTCVGVDGLVVGNVEGVVFGGGTCVQGLGIVGQ